MSAAAGPEPAWHTWSATEAALRVGVSTCLLGQPVRYDGGHKRNAFLLNELDRYVEWVPVCPEVEAGMGVPRPTLQLIEDPDAAPAGDEAPPAVRLVETKSGDDHTKSMERFSAKRVRQLQKLDLCGYVLKRDSPSCGMDRVKVRAKHGGAGKRNGRGVFAQALLAALPELPVEEEGRLGDARLRENFIERIFARQRLLDLFSGRWKAGDVVRFHTAHKLQVMAHSPKAYGELGRLVANVKQVPRAEFRARYSSGLMAALSLLATRGRVTNVLQHMAGYLRKPMDAASRAELGALVEDYRQGLVPLVVPLVLLRHHARRFEIDYLLGQVFLDPHPRELMLRNHV